MSDNIEFLKLTKGNVDNVVDTLLPQTANHSKRRKQGLKDLSGRKVSDIINMSEISLEHSTLVEDVYVPSAYKKHFLPPRKGGKSYAHKYSVYPFMRYGQDNRFPSFLLDLVTKSTAHRSAFRAAKNTAYGKGWVAQNEESNDFLSYVKKKLPRKVTMSILGDLCLYGGCYLSLTFKPQLDTNRNKKSELTVGTYKYEKIRLGYPETIEDFTEGELNDLSLVGEIIYGWYHSNYNTFRSLEKKYLRGIPFYRSVEDIDNQQYFQVKSDKKSLFYDKEGTQILNSFRFIDLISNDSVESEYYPTPTYLTDAFIDACYVDALLSAFDVAQLKNGLAAKFIVTVPVAGYEKMKETDPDRAKSILQEVKAKVSTELEGAENAGVSVVVVQDIDTDDQSRQPIEVVEIPHTNESDMHEVMETRKIHAILTGWGVTDSRIVGIPQPKGATLASQSEMMKTALNIFYTTVVFPDIVCSIEEWVNSTLKEIYAKETGKAVSDNVKVRLQRNRVIIPNADSNLYLNVLTLNEIREMLGYEPLDESQMNDVVARQLAGMLTPPKEEEIPQETVVQMLFDIAGIQPNDAQRFINQFKENNDGFKKL